MMDGTANDVMIRRATAQPVRFFGALRLIGSIIRHRSLVWEMAKRDLTDRHAGQVVGIVWLAVHPLLQFAVYAFLFAVVFKVRVGDRGPSDYLIYLFSGLVPWLLTQDVLARSASAIVENSSIVKKVMFPIEVLTAKTMVSSVAVQSVLFAAVVIYIAVARQAIPPTFLLLPFLLVLHLALLWGLALLLGSVTPYFRDVPELVRVFVTLNIYLMPVLYLPDMVPAELRFVLAINPFSSLIWCYQDVLYSGSIRHPGAWVALPLISGAALAVGSYAFVRLRQHFADVL
jgi:lipopolysaccharide transport system permease protein